MTGHTVMLSGRERGLTPQMKRDLIRRSAIEATIGHLKTDGRLDRNFLKGHAGDAINALEIFLVGIMVAAMSVAKTVKENTCQGPELIKISMD